jgi:hypothetical protein
VPWKTIPTGLDGSIDTAPSLYLDRRSDPYCAWINDEGLNFAYFSGEDWFWLGETTATAITTANTVPRHPICLDGDEKPHLLYLDANERINSIYWNGAEWATDQSGSIVSPTAALGASLAYNGEVYIFRISAGPSLVACKSDSGSWTTLDTATIEGTNADFDLLARPVGDNIHLFWKVNDTNNGRIDHVIFDTVSETFGLIGTIGLSDGVGEITDLWFFSHDWLPTNTSSSSTESSSSTTLAAVTSSSSSSSTVISESSSNSSSSYTSSSSDSFSSFSTEISYTSSSRSSSTVVSRSSSSSSQSTRSSSSSSTGAEPSSSSSVNSFSTSLSSDLNGGLLCWTKRIGNSVQVHSCWVYSNKEKFVSPLNGSQVNAYSYSPLTSTVTDFTSPYYSSVSGYADHERALRLAAVSSTLVEFKAAEGTIYESAKEIAGSPRRVAYGARQDSRPTVVAYMDSGRLSASVDDEDEQTSSSSSSEGFSSSSSSTFASFTSSSSSYSSITQSSISPSSSSSVSTMSGTSSTTSSCSWCLTSSGGGGGGFAPGSYKMMGDPHFYFYNPPYSKNVTDSPFNFDDNALGAAGQGMLLWASRSTSNRVDTIYYETVEFPPVENGLSINKVVVKHHDTTYEFLAQNGNLTLNGQIWNGSKAIALDFATVVIGSRSLTPNSCNGLSGPFADLSIDFKPGYSWDRAGIDRLGGSLYFTIKQAADQTGIYNNLSAAGLDGAGQILSQHSPPLSRSTFNTQVPTNDTWEAWNQTTVQNIWSKHQERLPLSGYVNIAWDTSHCTIELDDTLVDGTVGGSYTGLITASGGDTPYTFSLSSGDLPGGLSLDVDGTITGTCNDAGTFNFKVIAVDSNGNFGMREYSVTVASPDLPEGCYSAGPCSYCEGGAAKRTPQTYTLSVSIGNLGCINIYTYFSGYPYYDTYPYYTTLGAFANSGEIRQSEPCRWVNVGSSSPPWPPRIPLWTMTSLCSSPDCVTDCNTPSYWGISSQILLAAFLTRISDTQFTLDFEFVNSSDYGGWLLSCDQQIINADNCRSAMSGTADIKNKFGFSGPGTVIGTLAWSLTVKCP